MNKRSIAIAFLVVAASSAGQLAHLQNLAASQAKTPSIIPAVLPFPSCPPACAIPTPSQIPQ